MLIFDSLFLVSFITNILNFISEEESLENLVLDRLGSDVSDAVYIRVQAAIDILLTELASEMNLSCDKLRIAVYEFNGEFPMKIDGKVINSWEEFYETFSTNT